MDNIYSSFPNCKPTIPRLNPSKEPLSFGISIVAPVSSVPGSSSFFFLQPLLTGKVFASVVILISTQLFLVIADRFFGLETMPVQIHPVISPDQTVRMSLRELQDFLGSMTRAKVQTSTTTSTTSTTSTASTASIGQTAGDFVTESQEVPLVFALAVWGDFTNKLYSPNVFLTFPLFTLPGARGVLPLLILELLATIFVRAVVPPQTTGAQPLTDPASSNQSQSQLLQFSPEDLMNLLNQFSKHFRSSRLSP